MQYSIKEAKQAYNDHYNEGKNIQVSKKELAQFFASLVEADLDAITIIKDERS